ncbi:hypothetical protein [Catellatospora citrea]|uniref:Uncharacterized protein n=1 Tax=Catellatospora citrea TaxID=53366 RepID=A0A8J3P367_9ACTN|nr:hypothetical protein [Catellatospora citrea]RKE07915.1 hypothetical protein C8E86_2754 [Catellatospora citrea]GIG02074.1 hypothetical protein Cci01nite_71670 [Catellatospora citrea]
MNLHVIAMYHNAESRFFPYEDGHRLRQVISHWRHWPTGTDPYEIADWAWHVFNADLDMLESGRGTRQGEADFLIASVYRLMRHRSLSTGDVLAITTDGITTWLACESIGWRQITTPANPTGTPLTAEAVYRRTRGSGDE